MDALRNSYSDEMVNADNIEPLDEADNIEQLEAESVNSNDIEPLDADDNLETLDAVDADNRALSRICVNRLAGSAVN